MATVLLLFDSRGGLTEQLADAVAEGVRSIAGITLSHRRLDEAAIDELKRCDALILGSPNWSGMTGKLKDWMDHSSWVIPGLERRVAVLNPGWRSEYVEEVVAAGYTTLLGD